MAMLAFQDGHSPMQKERFNYQGSTHGLRSSS
jgi:hypothetical protein